MKLDKIDNEKRAETKRHPETLRRDLTSRGCIAICSTETDSDRCEVGELLSPTNPHSLGLLVIFAGYLCVVQLPNAKRRGVL
jgi:hypothetical protein